MPEQISRKLSVQEVAPGGALPPYVATFLCIAYALLILYGSLVPFDFTFEWDLVSDQIAREWKALVAGRAAIGKRDLVSNVFLHIPFGLLVAMRLTAYRRFPWAMSLIGAGAVSASTAIVAESLQLFLPSRGPQAFDVLAGAAGGMFGAGVWCVFVQPVWPRFLRWLQARKAQQTTIAAAVAMCGLLVLDAWEPLYPTVHLSQLTHNLRHSHTQLSSGLAVHTWHHWAVCRMGVYAVLTVLIGSALSSTSWRKWVIGALLASLFAVATEAFKPFIEHRVANIANVFTAACGSCVGMVLGMIFGGRLSARGKVILAATLLAGYIVYHQLKPFTFEWNLDAVKAQLPNARNWWPGYDFAVGRHGAYYVHTQIRALVLLAGFWFVICRRGGWAVRGSRFARVAKAAIVCGTLGLGLELLQLFIPGRSPGTSDVLCFAAGGALGAWASLVAEKDRIFIPPGEHVHSGTILIPRC